MIQIQPSNNSVLPRADQIIGFRQGLAQLTQDQVLDLTPEQQASDEFYQNHPSQHQYAFDDLRVLPPFII